MLPSSYLHATRPYKGVYGTRNTQVNAGEGVLVAPRPRSGTGAWQGAENSAVSVLMKRWLFQNGNGDFVPSHATLCPCLGMRGGGGFRAGHSETAGRWKHQKPSPWILSRQKDGSLFSPGEQVT